MCLYGWGLNVKGFLNIKKGINQRLAAFLLSVLLHVLVLLLYIYLPQKDLGSVSSQPPSDTPEVEEKRIAFELVETPPYIPRQEPDESTNLASTQNSQAADMYENSDIAQGLPYSEGVSDVKNYPDLPPEISPPLEDVDMADNQNETIDESHSNDFLADLYSKKLNSNLFESMNEPDFDNINSSAEELGGFSFNTYDWNYAPYLLRMKKRIRSNMNLPYAFTHLGAISGDVMIHFVVQPTGVVSSVEIMDSDAHYSLEKSSMNAIKYSSAFEPLPRDFPEDKLEVTARFSFSIIKK